MLLVHLLWFLLIGLAAGWLGSRLLNRKDLGVVGDLVVGVVGALLGGLLFRLLGFVSYNLLGSLVSATVGAMLFLLLLDRMRR